MVVPGVRVMLPTGEAAITDKNGFYNNSNCRFDGSQPTFPKMLARFAAYPGFTFFRRSRRSAFTEGLRPRGAF